MSASVLEVDQSLMADDFMRPTGGWRQQQEYLVDEEPEVFSVQIGRRKFDIELQGAPRWFDDAISRLRDISLLPTDWDSYGAPPPSQNALDTALIILINLSSMDARYRLPALGATPQEGVVIEWHDNVEDLEINIDRNGRLSAYYSGAGAEWEGNVSRSLIEIKPYFERLAKE